jgi:hypothetical protein
MGKNVPVVYKHTCGHIGRQALLNSRFIRVAEIRGAQVKEARFPCPDCKRDSDVVVDGNRTYEKSET